MISAKRILPVADGLWAYETRFRLWPLSVSKDLGSVEVLRTSGNRNRPRENDARSPLSGRFPSENRSGRTRCLLCGARFGRRAYYDGGARGHVFTMQR